MFEPWYSYIIGINNNMEFIVRVRRQLKALCHLIKEKYGPL